MKIQIVVKDILDRSHYSEVQEVGDEYSKDTLDELLESMFDSTYIKLQVQGCGTVVFNTKNIVSVYWREIGEEQSK